MPAAKRKQNVWPFAKKKRVVRSKEELAQIAATHRAAESAYLSSPPKGKKRNAAGVKKVIRGGQSAGRDALKLYDNVGNAVWAATGGIPRRIAGIVVGEKNPITDRAPRFEIQALQDGNWHTVGSARATFREGAVKVYRSEHKEWSKGKKLRALPREQNPRNPQDGAEAMYESFHGKRPEGETIVKEEFHQHEHLAPLGLLVSFKVITMTGVDMTLGTSDAEAGRMEYDETAANEDSVFLAANEDGTQLYFVGGDQSFPLDRCKMGENTDWYRDDMIVGVLYEVTYRTKKKFDKFKLTDYFHHLGEETGDQPMLRYDPLSPHLYVSGGKYKIKMPLIGMSPGIEN